MSKNHNDYDARITNDLISKTSDRIKRITAINKPQSAIKKRNNTSDLKSNENPINTEVSSSGCIDLVGVVGKDIVNNLTKSEERRLKADIKRGYKLSESKVLRDMLKRCPHLKMVIQNILNENKKVPDNDQDTNVKNSKKRQPITTNKSPKIANKKPRFDKKINDTVHDLGSEDTETDTDDDDYVDDGFVTTDTDDDCITEDDLSAECVDLYKDQMYHNVKTRYPKRQCEDKNKNELNKKIKEFRGYLQEDKIDVAKITSANFNKDDTIWFYKNIKRVAHLDGKERFDLEDKIEQRYKLLKTLQTSNLYKSFNKGADRDTTKEILESNHADHVKSILLNKIYSVMDSSMDEYQKTLNWLDIVLNLPTEIKSSKQDIKTSMNILYENLNKNMYGMDNVIQQVLQAVCTILTDPNNNGYILTLVGPPGVGKTTISTLIASAIGMGFGQISCGSINDQSTIVGHGSTYIGSKPGIFTQCLINNGQLDNVILLDEMDKLCDSKMIPILLHVLDKTQNNRFKDAFCPEIDIDLSKNLFIVAVNSLDSFDEALKDRLKVVKVNGYDIKQKINICVKHLIPRLIKKTKINAIIDTDIVKRCIVAISPDTSGVRDLERFFGDVYEKLLLITHMGPKFYNLPEEFNIESLEKIDAKLIQHLTGLVF